jgi:hypothetical protein
MEIAFVLVVDVLDDSSEAERVEKKNGASDLKLERKKLHYQSRQ